MTDDKVLVAAIVFDEHEPFLDQSIKALQAQDFRDTEIIFIDCVGKPEARKKMEKAGKVIDSVMRIRTKDAMIDSREKIIDHFKDSKATHLLFLDPDIILPEKAISRLMFHPKKVVSATYLFSMKLGDNYEICPCLYGFAGDDSVRVLELREVLDNNLIEIACAGLGCTLVTRDAVKTLGSPAFAKPNLNDDISFFVSARDAGIECFADTSVKCNRLVKPGKDNMNDPFSFDSYPKIRNPKVLVGCVTYDKDEAHIPAFLESVRAQDYSNFDIVFADTSGKKEFIAQLKGSGSIVLECFNDQDHSIKKITDGRNAIQEYAVKNDYDYVWFVDTDVEAPPTALSKLLSNRKDIIAGIYLASMNIKGTQRVMPVVYDFSDEADSCCPLFMNHVRNEYGVKAIAAAGFGCTLATRDVFEKVRIRYFDKSMAGEDIAFFIDAREAGFNTFADFSVRCAHVLFPPGDPRNRKFRFETYEQGQSYTLQVDNISKEE